MEARFRAGNLESGRLERDSDMEMKKHLDAMHRLLARLVEQGGDLSSGVKKAFRVQIQAHLQALGLESLEDYEGLTALYQRLHERSSNLPSPTNYHSRADFRSRLNAVYHLRAPENLPKVPENVRIRSTHLSLFGQTDWSMLAGRGGVELTDYLYDLGKVMASELAYTVSFNETDPIVVSDGWKIENGRHRALTLRILGPQFVNDQGMDAWISVYNEKHLGEKDS